MSSKNKANKKAAKLTAIDTNIDKVSTATNEAAPTSTTTNIIGQAATNLRALMIEAVIVQRSIDSKSGGVSDKLLKIAVHYQDSATIDKEDDTNADKFLSACETDERFIKSTDAGDNQVDKLPRYRCISWWYYEASN